MNLLITGANGFIGKALGSRLSSDRKIIGVDITEEPDKPTKIAWEHADIINGDSVAAICGRHTPDVIIHCGGIAHQKIGSVDRETYIKVNSEATENLAEVAARNNPELLFVFLSSISVYGEERKGISRKGTRTQSGFTDDGVEGDADCNPSSDYAYSKLDAEKRLISLYEEGLLRNLIILRLAPVYDREWSLNLDRRVFAPMKMAYLKFGSGNQRMFALARPNLVDFIDFLIRRFHRLPQIGDEATPARGLTTVTCLYHKK